MPSIRTCRFQKWRIFPGRRASVRHADSRDAPPINNQALPPKLFRVSGRDPLAAITATLAKFEEDEEAWIQLVQPASKNWHRKSERYISGLREGGGGTSPGALFKALVAPPEHASQTPKLTEYDQPVRAAPRIRAINWRSRRHCAGRVPGVIALRTRHPCALPIDHRQP